MLFMTLMDRSMSIDMELNESPHNDAVGKSLKIFPLFGDWETIRGKCIISTGQDKTISLFSFEFFFGFFKFI